MTDFLLELRSEEIPARMQGKARDDLARLFAAELDRAGLHAAAIVTFATPRRLALIARDLPEATAAVSDEVKGPRASAPPQALDGFLRKTGLSRDQLTERDGIFFAVTEKPGRATAAVLAEAIPAIIRAFPWPKSMRWGDASVSTDSLRWVRPLHGIVALFGEEVVPIEIAGITSGAATLGHRFHHPGPITIGSAADYVDKLRLCHVIVDGDERARLIRDRAAELAAEAGLDLIADEGLVAENAGLTEWPVPLLGRFDEAHLAVPPEVIQLTARVNQKYFVLKNPPRDGEGNRSAQPNGGGGSQAGAPSLAPAFICTANLAATDGGERIIEGNRKVLAARLSDARFFYDADLKVPLEEQAKKLDRIVFHEKLGTVADKVDRVAKLARWLVEEGIVGGSSPSTATTPRHPRESGDPASSFTPQDSGIPAFAEMTEGHREELAAMAERAARLCKADLATGMVGEFPELQGVMGGYYARNGAVPEDPRVADAIRDHYKPVGQGDEVPTDPVTVAVSLADKLDTLICFFAIGSPPTGSKDPFALRRAVIGIIRQSQMSNSRVNLYAVVPKVVEELTFSRVRAFCRLHPQADHYVNQLWPDFPKAGGSIAEVINVAMVQNADPFLRDIFRPAVEGWYYLNRDPSKSYLTQQIQDFAVERLKAEAKTLGMPVGIVEAVTVISYTPVLGTILTRALTIFDHLKSENGSNLVTGYRRAANILKKESYDGPVPIRHPGLEPGSIEPQAIPPADSWTPDQVRGDIAASPRKSLSYTPELAEETLHAALDSAEPAAADAVAREDFGAAMAALASLRAPIDQFFEAVTVNDPDAAKRAARLALLARVRDAVHTVADFSKIEG